jgi:hypothetical protein
MLVQDQEFHGCRYEALGENGDLDFENGGGLYSLRGRRCGEASCIIMRSGIWVVPWVEDGLATGNPGCNLPNFADWVANVTL